MVKILKRREYTGCTVNFKTYTNSIWEKKKRVNEEENRAVSYNTHEAIISEDVFEKVQKIRRQRHRKTKSGRTSMFSGLVYCADCGEKLYYGATNNAKPRGISSIVLYIGSGKINVGRTSFVNLFSIAWCFAISSL